MREWRVRAGDGFDSRSPFQVSPSEKVDGGGLRGHIRLSSGPGLDVKHAGITARKLNKSKETAGGICPSMLMVLLITDIFTIPSHSVKF